MGVATPTLYDQRGFKLMFTLKQDTKVFNTTRFTEKDTAEEREHVHMRASDTSPTEVLKAVWALLPRSH